MAKRVTNWRRIEVAILSHPVLSKLPVHGRYLWIGMILAADPNTGMVCGDEAWLRRHILPGTRGKPAHIRSLIGCYCDHNMLQPCSKDGVRYYRITNYHVYQPTTPTTPTNLPIDEAPPPPEKAPPGETVTIDWAEHMRIWNTLASSQGLTEIRSLNDNRKKVLKARLREFPDFWEQVTREVEQLNDYMRDGGYITFDSILVPTKLSKLLEGNYREKRSNGVDYTPEPPTPEELECQALRELIYANREKIYGILGPPWDGSDKALTTTKGTYLWQDLSLRQLKGLAAKLALNTNGA